MKQQQNNLIYKDIDQFKVKKWKQICHATLIKKELENGEFEIRNITRIKRGHIDKGHTMMSYNTNVHVPNNRTSKQMKQKLAELK